MILSLDVGTTAAKAALIALDGTVHGRGESPIPTPAGPAGCVEQQPEHWLRAARAAIGQALASAEALAGAAACIGAAPDATTGRAPGANELRALALTGQMQDLILLGADGQPLRPAVLYADARAGEQAARLRRELLAWERTTGNSQDATSTAAQWLRLRETEPEVVRRARSVLLGPAGYLAHRLGLGAHVDLTTASTTGLLDLAAMDWASDVLAAIGLDRALLPALVGGAVGTGASHGARSSHDGASPVVGRTGANARDLLGLPAGIPVVLAPGDAGAATIGTVGGRPGRAYASLGTSGWIARIETSLETSDGPAAPGAPACGHGSAAIAAERGAAHLLALPVPADAHAHLRIGAVLAAGGAAAWSARAFLGGKPLPEVDALLEAREAERGRGPSGLLALPSIHGERFPVRDDQLRAAVIGMGAATDGLDVHRAVLEGVALALAAGLAPAGDSPADGPDELVVVGGGAASAPWRRILADVTGRRVRTVGDAPAEAPLIGAAIAATEALGLPAEGLSPLAERAGGSTIAPDPAAHAGHAANAGRHRALYDLLGS